MNRRKLLEKRAIFLAGLLAFALTNADATADMLTFSMPENVAGANPSGVIGAVVEDVGVNEVRLTMIVDLTGKNEYVSEWAFNLQSPFGGFGNLTTTFVSSKGGASAADVVTLARNGFTFDPSSLGKFDLGFQWTGTDQTFNGLDSVTYDIKSSSKADTFNANTFNAANGGGSLGTPLYTAAGIDGIGAAGLKSGELANTLGPTSVPEPASLVLLGTACPILFAAWFRRKRLAIVS